MNLSNRIALLQKAEDAARNGNHEEALGVISRCLDLYPTFSPARVLRAEILSRCGRTEDAVTELEGIIRGNPENIRARILITGQLIDLGRLQDAAQHLEFLEFMMPADDPSLQELRDRLEQGTIPEPMTEPPAVDAVEEDATEMEPGTGAGTGDAAIGESDEITEVLELGDLEVPDVSPDADAGDGSEPFIGTDRSEEPTVRIEAPAQLVESAAATVEEQSTASGEDVVGPMTAELVEQEAEVLESIEADEAIPEEEIVTVRREDSPAEGDDRDELVEEQVPIETRTMALVYEKQGMYQEALHILERLPEEEVGEDIVRIRGKLMSGGGGAKQRKIARLAAWLEKIQCG